jgi:GAF domain-containing protein
LAGLLLGESDVVANAANTASLLFMTLPDVNWVGFYFLRGARELVLGPFQGKPACVRIAVGAGVCGTAVARREAMVVADVHDFPGHIACDVNSRSELVIPLIVDGRCLGVLDLDSPNPGRFDKHDREGAAKIAEIFVAASQWP